MKIPIFFLLIIVLFSGCAHSINQLNAEKYYNLGEQAVAQGDLLHAKKMYTRALINARYGRMEPNAQSQIYMKLGRVHGNLCEHKEAEKYFQNIIEQYKTDDEKKSKYIFMATMELGQFNYDIRNYKKAVIYFEKALKIDGDKLKKNYPTVYYEILTDYSHSLEQTDEKNKVKKINIILENNSQFLKEKSEYERYPVECK